MGSLDGRVAFITGAARGQRRSHAVLLAEEGADILAVDVRGPISTDSQIAPSTPDDLAQTVDLVKNLGRRIVTAQVDVRDYDALKAALDTASSNSDGWTSWSPTPASATAVRRWTRPANPTGTT